MVVVRVRRSSPEFLTMALLMAVYVLSACHWTLLFQILTDAFRLDWFTFISILFHINFIS